MGPSVRLLPGNISSTLIRTRNLENYESPQWIRECYEDQERTREAHQFRWPTVCMRSEQAKQHPIQHECAELGGEKPLSLTRKTACLSAERVDPVTEELNARSRAKRRHPGHRGRDASQPNEGREDRKVDERSSAAYDQGA